MSRREAGREIAYVPDAMSLVADLLEHDEAYGSDWALPGNGVASARQRRQVPGEWRPGFP